VSFFINLIYVISYFIKREKNMQKKMLVPILMVFVLMFSVTPVYAAPPPLFQRLDSQYFKINLLAGWPDNLITELDIPGNEIITIHHGWATGGPEGSIPDWPFWSEMTLRQKIEYLLTARFRLTIDSESVQLYPYIWYDVETDEMYVIWWRVFDANTFPIGGVFEFEGVWTIRYNGVLYTFTNTVTVTST
jgi:hypothetical protein